MKRGMTLALVALPVFAGALLAQNPPMMPKPAPELKRLGYFVGKWTNEGEMKAGPFGPGGKFTSTDNNEWFPGGFFMVLHSVGKTPMGPMHEMSVMGYDTDDKVYTYDGFDNMGEHDVSKGTVQGDTWTWNGESKMQGKMIKGRFTIKELSPASYTYKFEYSADGSSWITAVEGKATKVK
jgi:hypothetical protein